jgi:hypothetical protein
MKRIVLLLALAGASLSADAETLNFTCSFTLYGVPAEGAPQPTCDAGTGSYSVGASADHDMLLAWGLVQQVSGVCFGCGDAYEAYIDISFSHAETITINPVGGTGLARLVAAESEWQDANDDVGWTGLDYVVPETIDRSKPFDVTLEIGAGGQIHAGSQYIGGSHVRAWRFADIPVETSTPEPSTYGMFGSGMLALAFLHRRKCRAPLRSIRSVAR